MKTKYTLLFSLLLSLGSMPKFSVADSGYLSNGFYSFNWDINVPLNNKDFISNTSAAGGNVQGRFFINPNMSVGGEIAWSSLYEYASRRTYYLENAAVTTDLYKYIYLLPMTATFHYYFNPDGNIMPYAGLGLGAMYSEQDLYFNIYNLYATNWGFLVKPEAGAIFKFGDRSRTGAMLGVRYNYATNRESDLRIERIKTLSINVGIVFFN
ncbi:MAG: outer membrane beta-barrel protein [Bacteroidota bacterium]|jgi:opacity protein-like surface antigen